MCVCVCVCVLWEGREPNVCVEGEWGEPFKLVSVLYTVGLLQSVTTSGVTDQPLGSQLWSRCGLLCCYREVARSGWILAKVTEHQLVYMVTWSQAEQWFYYNLHWVPYRHSTSGPQVRTPCQNLTWEPHAKSPHVRTLCQDTTSGPYARMQHRDLMPGRNVGIICQDATSGSYARTQRQDHMPGPNVRTLCQDPTSGLISGPHIKTPCEDLNSGPHIRTNLVHCSSLSLSI